MQKRFNFKINSFLLKSFAVTANIFMSTPKAWSEFWAYLSYPHKLHVNSIKYAFNGQYKTTGT